MAYRTARGGGTMSTPAPPASRSSGSGLTRKMGPLPLWGWMTILGVLVLIYAYYKKSQSANSSQTQSASTVNQPGGVDSSLVPQFINQEYVNTTPPSAPNITVNNTVPPPPTVISTPPATPPATVSTPKTISGSPGSYTTGLPGGLNEWTSTGKYSQIGRAHV